eukprot:UC4_evm2s219
MPTSPPRLLTFHHVLLMALLPLARSDDDVGAIASVRVGKIVHVHTAPPLSSPSPSPSCEPAPINGRRVHIIASPTKGKTLPNADDELGSVMVGGEECLHLDTSSSADISRLHWCRAHVNANTQQLWVSFHTDNRTFLSAVGSSNIKAADSNGTVLVDSGISGTLSESLVTVSHVAAFGGGSSLVVHVHSNSKSATRISSLQINGIKIPQAAGMSLPPQGHAVFVASAPSTTGSVWTAVLGMESASGTSFSGFGGRVVVERFPIEAWPTSTDCVSANDTNAATIRKLGVDSVFVSGGGWLRKCGTNITALISNLANASGGWFHVFLDGEGDGEIALNSLLSHETRKASVDAVLIGDEVDGGITADKLRSKLGSSLANIRSAPDVIVYQGSATHAFVGAFAGIADVQGSDAYAAACAPTQLPVVKKLPVTYPYEYLRNARDNTVPQHMWGYSQLYNGNNKMSENIDLTENLGWPYQPEPAELCAQIAMTVASGSKGLMLFQTEQALLVKEPVSAVAKTISSVRSVSEIARLGDIEGVRFTSSSNDALIETILAPNHLLVVVINIAAKGYSNLLCHTDLDKHWKFSSPTISIKLHLASAPQIVNATGWREIVGDKRKPVDEVGVDVKGISGNVTLSGISLSDKAVARFFVADLQGMIK